MLNSQAIITYQCWYCLTPLWEHWCWSSNMDIEIFTQPQCHNNRNITMRPFQCKRKQSQGRTCSSSKKFSSLKIPKCKYAPGDWKAKCDTLEKCDTHPTQSGPIAIFKILQNEIYPKLTFKYLKVGMETNGKFSFHFTLAYIMILTQIYLSLLSIQANVTLSSTPPRSWSSTPPGFP